MKLRLSQLFIASAAAVSFSVIAAGQQQDRQAQAQQPGTPSTGASASQQQPGAAAGASQPGASEKRDSAAGGATQQPGAAAGASQQPSAAAGASQPMGQQHDQQTIRKVQEKLSEKGHQVQVDGMMGPETQQALREFQKKEGIQETGQLDQQTLSALGVEETGAAAGAGAPASGAPASGAPASDAPASGATTPGAAQQPGQTEKKY
jgi:peptidoglycan hydrolase-like protein with peptidoglycan-binding domain